jgi:acyl-CoA synthetase (AMP-forming)/AMP-acid ligase II
MPAEERMAPGGDNPIPREHSSDNRSPKGKCNTHETYHSLLGVHWIDLGQGPSDRTLAVLPLASAAGRSLVLATLLVGGSVFFAPPLLEPRELVTLCHREAINRLCIVPSILRGPGCSTRIRAVIAGYCIASPVSAMLFPEKANCGANFASINYYGSTAGGINTMLFPYELERKPGSVGRPTLGTELQVVDEADNMLPAGETGRLRVRCPNTCWGIYPPDPTDTTYFEGWHYPGDYALIDADGYLFLQGRYNDIIIRGGSNVYAPEVERVLLGSAGVREAAVFGIPHANLGEEVVACIVADETVSEAALVRRCRGNLAAYKVPTRIHRLPSLPRNSAGKILKRKLLELFDSTG